MVICVAVWFVVIAMLLSGVSVLCTIVVMNINHHGAQTGVPRWAKRFFLQKVAACLCIRHDQFMDDDDESESTDKKTELGAVNQKLDSGKETPSGEVGKLRRLLKELSEAKEKRRENEEEWQFLAIVIDRILFCIFGIAIVLFLIFIFINLLVTPRPANM